MTTTKSLCKEWQLSGLDVWAVTPLNARVRIISVGKHADMNGIDSVAIARLVASAPNLLEALEAILTTKIDPEDESPWVVKARAAFTRATTGGAQ